jgi:hypothetical protein
MNSLFGYSGMSIRRKCALRVEYYLAPDVSRLAEVLRGSGLGERHPRDFRRANRALLHERDNPIEMLTVPGDIGSCRGDVPARRLETLQSACDMNQPPAGLLHRKTARMHFAPDGIEYHNLIGPGGRIGRIGILEHFRPP